MIKGFEVKIVNCQINMDEVIAVWNQATDSVKKMIPKVTWENSKTDSVTQTQELRPISQLSQENLQLKRNFSNMPTFDRFVLQGSPFVRLAGLSGASAVALGAYGAHSKHKDFIICV